MGQDAIGVVAPSCSAVILGGHPMISVRIPFIHGTLESAAASASGVKRALVAQGKPDTTVLCLAGDGGTYDIGLQSLSSAAERNEDILYVCFDNQGYMNTGGQKSVIDAAECCDRQHARGQIHPQEEPDRDTRGASHSLYRHHQPVASE